MLVVHTFFLLLVDLLSEFHKCAGLSGLWCVYCMVLTIRFRSLKTRPAVSCESTSNYRVQSGRAPGSIIAPNLNVRTNPAFVLKWIGQSFLEVVLPAKLGSFSHQVRH